MCTNSEFLQLNFTCQIRIRIQNTVPDPDAGGDLITDPPGSGSETLLLSMVLIFLDLWRIPSRSSPIRTQLGFTLLQNFYTLKKMQLEGGTGSESNLPRFRMRQPIITLRIVLIFSMAKLLKVNISYIYLNQGLDSNKHNPNPDPLFGNI